ncbi:hypothetical protein SAMN05216298_2989 [Glycomyces sambucus]|uniref:Uncharacterized protein n=1 Tax=Glycomyces sambucus TaxID=380244 RepID=A0A1G9I2P3_9ACTN|nr:hypothetical protein [Glycomyces sambucus]SDL19335.1 hypothetical protein SAMN05216298_2989 [Glycomyces sambucus]
MDRQSRGRNPSPGELERGRFSDGHTDFTVRASSVDAPDSFQVSAEGNPADIVLIVSGINSGRLHATWGQGWRSFAPDWKVWVEDAAFKVFYNGVTIGDRRQGKVRFCDG